MDQEPKQTTVHLKRTILIVGAVVTLLLFSIWQATSFVASGAQMDKQIEALYDTKAEALTLNPKITQKQIDQLQEEVDHLPVLSRAYYSNQVDDLQRQYDNYQAAKKLFDSNGNLVSDLDVDKVEAMVKECERGALTRNACQLYSQAQTTLSKIDEADQAIDQLPQEVSVRGDLIEAVQALGAIEDKYQHELDQPQGQVLRDKLSQYAHQLAEGIKAASQYGDYDDEQIAVMNASHFLKEELKGTMYDNDPLIALTFDDGPNPDHTPEVLDVLKKYNVKATFFLMGAYVEQHPEIVQRIVEEGHQIGNHSYSHPDMSKLSDEEVLQQFEWCQQVIEDAVGFRPDIYRLPFGAGGARVVKLMEKEGMTSILWNIDTLDWSSHDADAIVQETENALQKHSLLLMHDTHAAAAPALDRLIPMLQERGYQFAKPQDLSFKMRYFAE